MLQHHEIQLLNIPERQKNMLLAIADYEQGWISESDLEEKLRKVLLSKETPKKFSVSIKEQNS